MKYHTILVLIALFSSCNSNDSSIQSKEEIEEQTQVIDVSDGVSLIILGTVQDAGSPQIGCEKECCKGLFENPKQDRKVVSLGVIDAKNKKKYLFEASPDFVSQAKRLSRFGFDNNKEVPDGIFLTHAHIGHYTGLMYLGKEATNAAEVPVYAMPKMKSFLKNNGPWSQLVANKNIITQDLESQIPIELSSSFQVIPFTVPHRDEFSETVGYKIIGPKKTALFIPDIDKWSKWDKDIIEEVAKVDYAFIDATFYDAEEINNRDISEIPHPFIIESMELFKDLSTSEKSKIHFIHMNHTNPALNEGSPQSKKIIENGFNTARYNDVFEL
jgi:pyrroloquinoline quinone biosynthesis protein B